MSCFETAASPLEVHATERWGTQKSIVLRMGVNQEYFRMQIIRSVGLDDIKGLF